VRAGRDAVLRPHLVQQRHRFGGSAGLRARGEGGVEALRVGLGAVPGRHLAHRRER
jgi:hypothetical protein